MAPNSARLVRQRLEAELRTAMRSRNAAAAAAFRSALSAIDNAESAGRQPEPPAKVGPVAKAHLGVGVAEVARRQLSAHEVAGILRAEIAERASAAAEYERLGRPDHAARLREEAAALLPHLEE
jgi:uncharacterized protein